MCSKPAGLEVPSSSERSFNCNADDNALFTYSTNPASEPSKTVSEIPARTFNMWRSKVIWSPFKFISLATSPSFTNESSAISKAIRGKIKLVIVDTVSIWRNGLVANGSDTSWFDTLIGSNFPPLVSVSSFNSCLTEFHFSWNSALSGRTVLRIHAASALIKRSFGSSGILVSFFFASSSLFLISSDCAFLACS